MRAFILLLLSIVGSPVKCRLVQSRLYRRDSAATTTTQPSDKVSSPRLSMRLATSTHRFNGSSLPTSTVLATMILPTLRGMEELDILIRRLTTSSPNASPNPSTANIEATIRPLRTRRLSTTLHSDPALDIALIPSHSISATATFADTAVRCISEVESEEFRLVEIPYFCEIQTIHGPGVDLLERMERFVLTALAEGIRPCYNEEIRRSLRARAEQYSRVVAAYSSARHTISDQYTCSISNTHICTIVEGTITLAVEGGSSSDDGDITDEAFTTLRRAFHEFDDPDILSVNYFRNNTTVVSLIDQYSPTGVMDTAKDGNEYGIDFLVLSVVCSLFTGIILFVLFLSIRNDESGDEEYSVGDTCSVSVASSHDDCTCELGCDPPPSPKP